MYPGQHAVQRADQPAIVMAAIGRNHHLSRARGAQQPSGASSARDWPQAARSLCHLHGEPSAVRRVLRRGRAVRALLHRRQFVSDRGRARLYRQQQPVEGARSRRRRSARSRLRRSSDCPKVELCLIVDGPGAGIARAQFRRGDGRISRNADWRRVAGSGDALFLGHHRADPRACCVRCPISRPTSRCRRSPRG